MKIFGVEIKRSPKQVVVQDQVPEVKVSVPEGKQPATIPTVKDPVLRYSGQRARGRGFFHSAEYNLAEVGRIEDTDSYVRQAFNKKLALMFKEGWDIVGPDPKIIKYVKIRFAQMAQASDIPTKKLFRDIGSSLIRKSNSFLLKVRKVQASGGRIRDIPGKKLPLIPVAGYFPVPAETMEYQLSGNKVVSWQQKMPNGDIVKHNPQDIVHVFTDRKDGFVFGTPQLVPVIDDIRALRKIEENIELLVYQHLFPLFHYKVGTEVSPAGIDEDGNYEVDVVRREIQFMPTEGGIVTPERHEITAIGAEGRAIRAEGYVEHFKKRVFSGLGVSAVDMGEGETANRATADNMSRNMVDAVKDFQQVIEIFINEYIIAELLLESTFGPEVLNDDKRCHIKFKEIDVDAQIKKETHAADQFAKNAITWTELRVKQGMEPIVTPTPEEIEAGTATKEKYPQWHDTMWKLFKEPEVMMQSMDEPYSAVAKAAARNNSLETTQGDLDEAGKQKIDQEVALEKEKGKAKVAVAKATPRPKVKNGALANTFASVMQDIVSKAAHDQSIDHDWAAAQIRAQFSEAIKHLIADQVVAFQKGYSLHSALNDDVFIRNMAFVRGLLQERAERYGNRLKESIINSLKRNVSNLEPTEVAMRTRAVFESTKFRTEFIEDVEVRKAKNFGKVIGLRTKLGDQSSALINFITTSPEPCDRCTRHSEQPSLLGFTSLDDVAPFHAGCNCILSVVEPEQSGVQDAKMDTPMPGEVAEQDFQDCPKCGKTALRAKDTPNIYNCRACSHSFQMVEDTDVSTDNTEK